MPKQTVSGYKGIMDFRFYKVWTNGLRIEPVDGTADRTNRREGTYSLYLVSGLDRMDMADMHV